MDRCDMERMETLEGYNYLTPVEADELKSLQEVYEAEANAEAIAYSQKTIEEGY